MNLPGRRILSLLHASPPLWETPPQPPAPQSSLSACWGGWLGPGRGAAGHDHLTPPPSPGHWPLPPVRRRSEARRGAGRGWRGRVCVSAGGRHLATRSSHPPPRQPPSVLNPWCRWSTKDNHVWQRNEVDTEYIRATQMCIQPWKEYLWMSSVNISTKHKIN